MHLFSVQAVILALLVLIRARIGIRIDLKLEETPSPS